MDRLLKEKPSAKIRTKQKTKKKMVGTNSCPSQTHLDINDLIPDERLQEHAHEPNQSVLHVLVLDILAAGDTI